MFIAGKAAVVMSPPPSQEQHVPHWTDIDWDRSIANRLTNDLRVRFLDYGSGPALVLLHGMAASWQWRLVSPSGSRNVTASTSAAHEICLSRTK